MLTEFPSLLNIPQVILLILDFQTSKVLLFPSSTDGFL